MLAPVFSNPDGTLSLGQLSLTESIQRALTKLKAITRGWLVRLRMIDRFSDRFMRGRKGNMQIARWEYRFPPTRQQVQRENIYNNAIARYARLQASYQQ